MPSDFLYPLKTALSFLAEYWWVYTPFVLAFACVEFWLAYATQKYIDSIKWVLLEIKPPPDVQKSPKIAENIFSGLHGIYFPVGWKRRFFLGVVPDWFSFEIIGTGGEIHFYVRLNENLKSLVESSIFAQYPEAEIKVVDDYVSDLPIKLPDDTYDLWGTELVFTKPNAYPIKTYPYFEEESGKDEFRRTDPISPLAEIMSALEPGEHIWIQILIRPTGDTWVKEGVKLAYELAGKKEPPKQTIDEKIISGLSDLISGGGEEKKEEKSEINVQKLTPGQRYTLEQVENKLSKLGFKAGIRFVYISRKELFHRSHTSAITGMFKQLYANNLNSFTINKLITPLDKGFLGGLFPSDKGFFADKRIFKKKLNLYSVARKRSFTARFVILNTEELATLFHMPSIGVKAPSMPRVEAKKGQPPIGLPIRQ